MNSNVTIRVVAKIRPCNNTKNIIKTGENVLEVVLPSDDYQKVLVDFVHDANHTQESIYQTSKMEELMLRFVEGYNVSILTYGQTGSGKTFALQGTSQHPGIILHSITDIYKNKPQQSFLTCSFLQIYNQKISDMLNKQSKDLKLRWQIQNQFVVEDLTQKQCDSAEQMIEEWLFGCKNRVISSNKINQYSSRSHSVFTVKLEDIDHEGNVRKRQAVFVDLAGSERLFSPVGRLSKQAIQINKSLFFLRKVILSLEEMNTTGKEQFIPYRDSKLTSILKRAFGGNCLTILIACLNPHQDYLEQTLSTLHYAISARKINNQPLINIDPKSRQLKLVKQQNQKLQKQLAMALDQIQTFKCLEREEELRRASKNQYANRIIQCLGTVRQLLKSNKLLRSQLEQEKKEKNKLALELQASQKNLQSFRKNTAILPIKQQPSTKRTIFRPQPRSRNSSSPHQPASHSVQLQKKQKSPFHIIRRKRYTLHQAKLQ